MKPFDIELAKQGHPVCTRDGKAVRIICFDKKDKDFPIVALIVEDNGTESVYTHTSQGEYLRAKGSKADLFMVSTKHKGWINIYNADGKPYICSNIYSTKEEAYKRRSEKNYVTTIEIELED